MCMHLTEVGLSMWGKSWVKTRLNIQIIALNKNNIVLMTFWSIDTESRINFSDFL